jgi:hypothetical protein
VIRATVGASCAVKRTTLSPRPAVLRIGGTGVGLGVATGFGGTSGVGDVTGFEDGSVVGSVVGELNPVRRERARTGRC